MTREEKIALIYSLASTLSLEQLDFLIKNLKQQLNAHVQSSTHLLGSRSWYAPVAA